METHSHHFLAREIVRRALASHAPHSPSSHFASVTGLGVKGIVEGDGVVVGNRRWMHQEGLCLDPDMEERAGAMEMEGATVVFFGWQGRVRGLMAFGDALKPESLRTVTELKRRGMSLWLVSGDSSPTVAAVARNLGMEACLGGATPEAKLEVLRALRSKGHRVGMIGDGINDAAALAGANVGIAIGAGADMAHEAFDLTLLSQDPSKILDILDLSELTSGIIRQNLLFAFFYNLLAIPLAMGGLLNPVIAVLAMFASSLTVVGNTLRLSRSGE